MTNAAPGFDKHPNYAVTIEPRSERVQVQAGTTLLADTTRAVLVTETRHHPVWYLPLSDINPDVIATTETSTYCPFKGHASYWTITTADGPLADAMWSYRAPYDECTPLKDYVAFYTDRVDLRIDGVRVGETGPGWTE